MDRCFDCLARWLAPILCFTAEEAWLARHGDAPGRSVHLELFPEVPEAWLDPDLAARWDGLRELRRVATGALELERAAKRIGSSLQAAVEIFAPAPVDGVDLAELCITSAAVLRVGTPPEDAFTLPDVPGIGVRVGLADGARCERCWRVLPEVHDELCGRCTAVVGGSG
jgi:isoleucyl-tRNA synthetase